MFILVQFRAQRRQLRSTQVRVGIECIQRDRSVEKLIEVLTNNNCDDGT